MKPIIGITSSVKNDLKHTLANDYIEAIITAGGIPVILPIGIEKDIENLFYKIDGLLLSGGGDIDPLLFGEEPHPNLGEIEPGRDSLEMLLVQQALKLNKPVLAICRGVQILNIAVHGDMYQDIYSQIESPLIQHSQHAVRHHPSHYVAISPNSLLYSILKETRIKVNSFHHQAVRSVPKPFIISARSTDGIIEAIESTNHTFALGVQWHPECLAHTNEQTSVKIFRSFVHACKNNEVGK